MFFLTTALVGILFAVVVTYLWHIRKAYDFFIRLGIPGPPTLFFFGNFLEITKTRGISIARKQWTDKYGPVFGYFEGHTPILVISDPDILQDVFIKSFSNFHARRPTPLESHQAKDVSLFSCAGLRWKRQRFVLNPAFSSAKLKQMSPLIHHSIGMLMTKMAEQCNKGEPFDIYAYFKRFTMVTIWSCGFGLDTDMQNNVNDPYLVHSQAIFSDNTFRRIMFILVALLVELKVVWRNIFRVIGIIRYLLRRYIPVTKRYIEDIPDTWIMKAANEVIEKRKKIGSTDRKDLLQLMLESMSEEDFIQEKSTTSEKSEDSEIEAPLVKR